MGKKLICCMAAALMAAFSLPTPAAAQQTYTYQLLSDGTAEITCADTALVSAEIPAEIEGYTVTALASNAFSGCQSLQDVVFPETLTAIGDNAFQNCTALETITIPEQISKIGSFVFEGCTALTYIEVEDANTSYCDDSGVLYNGDKRNLVRYPAAKEDTRYVVADACRTIEPWAFTGCAKLQTLEMSGVTAIGADAFMHAQSLQKVVLSEGITELIGASFAYCVNLRDITLPDTLTSIGDRCFYGCASLSAVTLPDGLKSIGEMAFFHCVAMQEMTVPASVKTIGEMGIGYSVNPDTNENTLVSGFRMQVASGSSAFSYARRNDIAYTATMSESTIMLLICAALVLFAAGLACFIVFRRRRLEAERIAREKEAEKRAKKAERRKRKRKKS